MIGTIFRKEMLLMMKDRGIFFWLFVLPIAFIVIFAAIFSNTGDKGEAITQIVPGYTVMFVFFIMITMVQNFLRERDSGMLARLQGTPMRALHFLVGMWVPNIIVLLIQSGVLLTFGYLVYGLKMGNALAVACIILALAICATGIGLLMSVTVSSLNMGIALVQIIAMGGAILGGLWFPYDMLPKAVQAIGKFTPQYWAQSSLQEVMQNQAHLGDIWGAIALLLGIGAVGLLLAVLFFGRYARKGVA